jgi:perosamine synthetase
MARFDPSKALELIRRALGAPTAPVALHEPWFHGREWELVKACLDSGWVSTSGSQIARFEECLAEFIGAPYVIAVVNGTAALHICLKLVGAAPGDEVLIPALTFIATANAVSYCGAIPHFVDVEASSLGIDAAKLDTYLANISDRRGGELHNRNTGRRIAAIVPMHTFGHPVDMDALVGVSKKYGLIVVEDAAESLGSLYKGRHTGLHGKVAALSFNGNKIVTSGGGGAIVTSDAALAARAKHITTTARLAHAWSFLHDEVGYNYRLPNINAALGVAQMETLPEHLEMKRCLAERYIEAFNGFAGAHIFREPENARSNYWLNCLVLDEGEEQQRDALLELTNAAGIMTRPVWELMHHLPMYRDAPRMDLAVSESLARRIVNLPSSPQLMHAAT